MNREEWLALISSENKEKIEEVFDRDVDSQDTYRVDIDQSLAGAILDVGNLIKAGFDTQEALELVKIANINALTSKITDLNFDFVEKIDSIDSRLFKQNKLLKAIKGDLFEAIYLQEPKTEISGHVRVSGNDDIVQHLFGIVNKLDKLLEIIDIKTKPNEEEAYKKVDGKYEKRD